MRPLLLLLLAAPASAQTLEWSWPVAAVAVIGTPALASMEVALNDEDYVPLPGVTCGPVIVDVGMALDCTAPAPPRVTCTDHTNIYLRGTRESLTGPVTYELRPTRVRGCGGVSPIASCPHTSGLRGYGTVVSERIPVAQAPARLAQVRQDGWWVYPATASATSILVRLVCLR